MHLGRMTGPVVGTAAVVLALVVDGGAAAASTSPAPGGAPVKAPSLAVVVKDFPWLDGGRRVAAHGTTIGTIQCPSQASPPVLYTATRGTQASYAAPTSTRRPDPAVQVFRFATPARAARAYAGLLASARECRGRSGSGPARVVRDFVAAPPVGGQRFAYRTQGGPGSAVTSVQVDVYARAGDVLEVSTVLARKAFDRRLYDALAADLAAANDRTAGVVSHVIADPGMARTDH